MCLLELNDVNYVWFISNFANAIFLHNWLKSSDTINTSFLYYVTLQRLSLVAKLHPSFKEGVAIMLSSVRP